MFKNILEKVKKFAEYVAVQIVDGVGTISCTLLFFVWSLIPLFWKSATDVVAYVSSDILQLVLLPLIMVGEKLGRKKSSANHDKLHQRQDKIDRALTDIQTLLKEDQKQDTLLMQIIESQKQLAAEISELKKQKG
jgi:hypothetical protein